MVFLFATVGISSAQQRIANYRGNFHKAGKEISFIATNSLVKLNFCTPTMFRVRVSWNGSFEKDEQGGYAITKINCNKTAHGVKIHVAKPEGEYKVRQRHYRLKVHTDYAPESVKENGEILPKNIPTQNRGWHYDQDYQTLWIYPKGTSKNDIQINILTTKSTKVITKDAQRKPTNSKA